MITIYEARIIYEENRNLRPHIIEAGTLDMLKNKCKPWIDGPNVAEIQVVLIEEVGWFKSRISDYVKML